MCLGTSFILKIAKVDETEEGLPRFKERIFPWSDIGQVDGITSCQKFYTGGVASVPLHYANAGRLRNCTLQDHVPILVNSVSSHVVLIQVVDLEIDNKFFNLFNE